MKEFYWKTSLCRNHLLILGEWVASENISGPSSSINEQQGQASEVDLPSIWHAQVCHWPKYFWCTLPFSHYPQVSVLLLPFEYPPRPIVYSGHNHLHYLLSRPTAILTELFFPTILLSKFSPIKYNIVQNWIWGSSRWLCCFPRID